MNYQKLICPYDTSLLDRVRDRLIAVRIPDPALVSTASEYVRNSRNELFCIILEPGAPLDTIRLKDEWKDIPIALIVPSIGKFRDLRKNLNQLRKLNIRVYLPCNKDNLKGIRILASVGVSCCIKFDDNQIDWEALTDLMTYAVLEVVPHASIEPFSYISRNYNPASYTEWSSVYFEDPKQFLHLDARGRVALSHDELLKEVFIAENIDEIKSDTDFDIPAGRLEGWRELFLKNHHCSICKGWRVCLGKFSHRNADAAGCSAFFSEIIRISHLYMDKQAEQRSHQVWQL